MAQGAPVVTSAGTATAEVAGDAGLLVDPNDPGAIADALTRLLEDRDLADRLAPRRARCGPATTRGSGPPSSPPPRTATPLG